MNPIGIRVARSAIAAWLLFGLLLSNSAVALAQDLRIAFLREPPYIFEEQGNGILLDIVRTALEPAGYTVTPVYLSIARCIKMFAAGQVDGVSLIRESPGLKGAYSKNFINYYNGVFALKSRHLSVRSVADLQGKAVTAFQNAQRYLGSEYSAMASANPDYREVTDQESQVRMLMLGRADVIVLDKSIFLYYWRKFQPQVRGIGPEDYVAFDIFAPSPYQAAFLDPRARDAFDQGIAAMRKDGRYDAIYRRYLRGHP